MEDHKKNSEHGRHPAAKDHHAKGGIAHHTCRGRECSEHNEHKNSTKKSHKKSWWETITSAFTGK